MKDYIRENKKAWEEAFEHSSIEYKNRTLDLLKHDPRSLFTKSMIRLLDNPYYKGKVLGQFCSNNGRETLGSLVFGFQETIGFDLAKNMVEYANDLASKLDLNARFVETNILNIDSSYQDMFDVGMLTVGAIPWFQDLDELFKSIHKTLKIGADIIIEDIHPVANMLAAKGEPNYDAKYPQLIVNDYFKKTPWVEVEGMGYMTGNTYQSKTFTSYAHPMMDIINGLVMNGFEILYIEENNVDQSNMFDEVNESIIPLTFIIHAKKVR